MQEITSLTDLGVTINDSIESNSTLSMELNAVQTESKLISQLCNCGSKDQYWCFIHDKVLQSTSGDISFTDKDFGFMAKSTLHVPLFQPARDIECTDLRKWAWDAHTIVKRMGCPNYLSARIRVPKELNIASWRSLCGNYKDQLLLNYLEFGFPLCVNRSGFQLNPHVVNHQSAVDFPDDVDVYFNKELQHKAIVGPFQEFPFPVHYSPIMSRPKPDDTRRIIVNLSHPKGASFNDHIADDVYDCVLYSLKYRAIQDIVNEIQVQNSDVLLLKIDISRAFHNLQIDPQDFDLLALKWRDTSYLDVSVPMGMKTGSALCQCVTDVIRHVMSSKGVMLWNYIDDVICIHKRENTSAEFDLLYSLFEFLGIPMNPKKVVPPTRVLTCMGIIVDIDAGLLSIPHSKCMEILDLYRHYRTHARISHRQLQSLLGKLLYLHRCVIPARAFVNRLLTKLHQTMTHIKVCHEMKKDLFLVILFLEKFNGKVMFTQVKHQYDVFLRQLGTSISLRLKC